MSSRVLKGDAARPAEPIAWTRLATCADRPVPPAPDPPHNRDSRAAEELKARIAELEREIEHREQSALGAGFEKGRAAGEKEADARLGAAIERFAAAVTDLGSRRRALRQDAEADLVKLAIAIARRVLHRELNADPEAMLGLVKAALEKLDHSEVDRVRVHPADADAIRKQVDRLRPSGRVEIVPDARLDRGAAVFETTRGALDGSVETQLAEIERGLIDRLRS